MRSPGFLVELQRQLESLDVSILETVNSEGGLEISELISLLTKPSDHTVYDPQIVDDSVCSKINDDADKDSFWLGKNSLTSGETLFVLIASSEANAASIETQLMRTSWVKNTLLLVDPASKAAACDIVKSLGRENVHVIENYVTFLLTPDNRLDMYNEVCHVSSCGAGDLINRLRGLSLDCKYVAVVDAGNNNGLNSSLVGRHISCNKLVTAEMHRKTSKDIDTIFCNHGGFPQIVERHRLSPQASSDTFKFSGSGSYVFNISIIHDEIKWKWHRRKLLHQQRLVVKFERTLCDLTSFYQTQFVIKD